jgi:GNAT superfamily N-acetyltransferase
LEYRRLNPDSAEDIRNLQEILIGAPGYFLVVEGKLPGPDASVEVLRGLPVGKTLPDKYVYEIKRHDRPIGCFDVVRGYPNPEIAFIGLLLLVESEQGKSYGAEAVQYIMRLANAWGCKWLRIAVVDANKRALTFWEREGFEELYRKSSDRYLSSVIVMERHLKLHN